MTETKTAGTGDRPISAEDAARDHTAVYRCHREWEKLQPTEHALVRYCSECTQHVFHVRGPEELARAVAEGRCMYFENRYGMGRFLGYFPPELPLSGSLNWDE